MNDEIPIHTLDPQPVPPKRETDKEALRRRLENIQKAIRRSEPKPDPRGKWRKL